MKVRDVYDFLPKKVKGKNTAGSCQKAHFKQRFSERFGERCVEETYQHLRTMARSGQYFHKKTEDQRSEHRIPYKDMDLRVIYDSYTKELVTLLAW